MKNLLKWARICSFEGDLKYKKSTSLKKARSFKQMRQTETSLKDIVLLKAMMGASDKPISIPVEIAAWKNIYENVENALRKYPTTLAEDLELLKGDLANN